MTRQTCEVGSNKGNVLLLRPASWDIALFSLGLRTLTNPGGWLRAPRARAGIKRVSDPKELPTLVFGFIWHYLSTGRQHHPY